MKSNGSALIIAIILTFVTAIVALSGTQLILTAFKDAKHQQHSGPEVDNIARAGLVDTIAWFKRQTVQPVKSGVPPTTYAWADGAFNPRYNVDPTLCDTIDESIGLVKEYELSEDGTIWGRYEVVRQTNTTVAPWNQYAVHDVSGERLYSGEKNGDGYVWYIASKGYLYRKKNPAVAFNVAPNEIIAKSRVATEIRRLTLNIQVPCALIVNSGGTGSTSAANLTTSTNKTVLVYAKGRVYGSPGGTYGCGRSSGALPYFQAGSSITGTTAQYNPTSYLLQNHTLNYCLGVSTTELKVLADYVVTSPNQLPSIIPDSSLIYIDGNADFTTPSATIPRLKAYNTLLFVNGNLRLLAGSMAYITGFIYCTGTTTVEDGCVISGCLVSQTGVNVSRNAGATDVATIQYDGNAISNVRQKVCLYREIKSTYRVFTGVTDY